MIYKDRVSETRVFVEKQVTLAFLARNVMSYRTGTREECRRGSSPRLLSQRRHRCLIFVHKAGWRSSLKREWDMTGLQQVCSCGFWYHVSHGIQLYFMIPNQMDCPTSTSGAGTMGNGGWNDGSLNLVPKWDVDPIRSRRHKPRRGTIHDKEIGIKRRVNIRQSRQENLEKDRARKAMTRHGEERGVRQRGM